MITSTFFLITFIAAGSSSLLANTSASELPEIVVSHQTMNDLRLKKDDINRIQTLRPAEVQKKQAQTFAQAVAHERGVDTQTACAFCGSKRLSINGMKGEHTTVLIDGLPLHSTVSGFYGVEAIPLGGVDSIEIFRGAGAALTAPEAIGGAINIVTREVINDSAEGMFSYGFDGQNNVAVLGSKKIGKRTGLLLGIQTGEMLPLDLDGNHVAELPKQKTQTLISKLIHQLNDTDEVGLRLSYGKLQSLGGTMKNLKLSEATIPAVADDFLDRDVRKKFLGDESKLSESVKLERWELASIYRRQLDENSSLKLSWGGAAQSQQSIYSHGHDYNNKDQLWVGMAEYQQSAGENHLLAMGIDTKHQKMDSSSKKLFVERNPPLKQDDLTYRSWGGFLQDTWFINPSNELSLVLRFDDIDTRWTDLGTSIHKTVVAPRVMFKHLHNSILTSRISAGMGYRSPLTLFESQHGVTHDGFIVDIQHLETAHSLVYSLAGQRQDDFFEFSTHLTHIENLAYGLDRVNEGLPTIFKNAEDPITISVFDLSYGRRITHHWTLEGLAEFFHYPAQYQAKLPVAAIEKRFSLTSNVEWGRWSATQKLIVVGARNLAPYGYDKHYNIAPSVDPLDPSFGSKGQDPKWQRAPTYFTLDLVFARKINENLSASGSVLNVFNYTQNQAGDSPLTWHEHGDHYHLDNFHLWGPLRGRVFFLSLNA